MKYTTVTKYVDIETGEIVPIALRENYYTIRTNKKINHVRSKSGELKRIIIEYTNECRQRPYQGRLI